MSLIQETGRHVSMCAWAASYSKQGSYAFDRYCDVCKQQGWPALPVTEKTLYHFAVFRFLTTDNTGNSFQTELYNIRQALIRFGIRLNIRQDGPMIRLTTFVRGWKRERGPKHKRKPITSAVLARFFEHIPEDNHDDLLARAALAVAKFGMMRVSEYTYGEKGNCPKVGDLRLYPDAVEARYLALYFSKSKCNQHSNLERVICVCACPEPCAVHATIALLSARDSVHPDDDLFRYKSGELLTAKAMNAIIKDLCCRCSLDPSCFRPHGLRAGGITDILCEGVPDSVVQVLTRHKNIDSLRPYKMLSDTNLGTILSAHMDAHRIAKRKERTRKEQARVKEALQR